MNELFRVKDKLIACSIQKLVDDHNTNQRNERGEVLVETKECAIAICKEAVMFLSTEIASKGAVVTAFAKLSTSTATIF